jgi:hypothetical protein
LGFDGVFRPVFFLKTSHVQADTHGLAIRHPSTRNLPNIVGSVPNALNTPVDSRYWRFMLLLFKPWRTGKDLLYNRNLCWKHAFCLFLGDELCTDDVRTVLHNF